MKFQPHHYEIKIDAGNTRIHIRGIRYYDLGDGQFGRDPFIVVPDKMYKTVSPPNVLERLFGVTVEVKIDRAVARVRRNGDNWLKKNSLEGIAERANEAYAVTRYREEP